MSVKISSNVKKADTGRLQVRGADSRGTRQVEPTAFRRTLTDLTKEMHASRLQDMKKAIDEQGALLADRVDVRELEKYRRLIREFLDEIVSNGYTFTREDAYASRGRHRFFATVKIVDEKLDELGKEVLSEQADKIEILGKVDDIRGLLLDLMM